MRRGRLAKLRAGVLLPWTRPPYGYRLHPERPRDPAGVQVEPVEAAVVATIFATYLDPGASLQKVAQALHDQQVCSPTGQSWWGLSTLRGILQNPRLYRAGLRGPHAHPPAADLPLRHASPWTSP